jgi:hypothetical protein
MSESEAGQSALITAEGPIRWQEGGTARIQSIVELEVVLRSSVPYPPGKPAQGTLADGSMRYAFTAKVQRSIKVAEGIWDVRARLISATNELRAALLSAQGAQTA